MWNLANPINISYLSCMGLHVEGGGIYLPSSIYFYRQCRVGGKGSLYSTVSFLAAYILGVYSLLYIPSRTSRFLILLAKLFLILLFEYDIVFLPNL